MKLVALPATLLVLSVAAQTEEWGQFGIGATGPPGDNNPAGLKIYEDAGHNPNATSAVEFNRKYEEKEETWTWRINISEIAVPDNPQRIGDDSANHTKNLRVVNTQWQLGWPDKTNDSLLDLLASRKVDVQFQAHILVLPTKITDKYDENDNGDCTPMFGEDCTRKIAEQSVGMRSGSVEFYNFEECKDTLKQATKGRVNLGGGIGFGWDKSFSNSSRNFSLSRSDSLIYYTTPTYGAGNSTTMDYMKGAVQFIIMSFGYESSRERPGVDTGASLLCRIVDKEATKKIDDDGSDNSDKPGVASAVGQLSLGTVLGMVFISVILSFS